jgi:hypothetical protein
LAWYINQISRNTPFYPIYINNFLITYGTFILFQILLAFTSSGSYGSSAYNYLCNQCLSPLTLWVRMALRWGVLDTPLYAKICKVGDFLHQQTDCHDIAKQNCWMWHQTPQTPLIKIWWCKCQQYLEQYKCPIGNQKIVYINRIKRSISTDLVNNNVSGDKHWLHR